MKLSTAIFRPLTIGAEGSNFPIILYDSFHELLIQCIGFVMCIRVSSIIFNFYLDAIGKYSRFRLTVKQHAFAKHVGLFKIDRF